MVIFDLWVINSQQLYVGDTQNLCPSTSSPLGTSHLNQSGVKLKYFLDLKNSKQLQLHQIDYVLFHKDSTQEINYPPEYNRIDMSQCIQFYQTTYGTAWFEDDFVVVFKVTLPPTEKDKDG